MAVNKVVYDGRTLIDISDTTATADKILSGYTAYGADGNKVTGTAESGGVSPQPTEEKVVFFYDYEGTLLYSYTKAEFLALNAMPANPSHEGLVAQGWNWSLANAKTYIHSYDKLIIGQMYTTSSGDTELDVSLYEGRIDPYFGVAVKGTVTIYWGDGSSSSLTGTSLTTLKKVQHTYSAVGNYTISIHAEGTNEYSIYSNKSSGPSALLSSVSSTSNSSVQNDSIEAYIKCIKAVRIGNNISTIGARAFQGCTCLEYVSMPDSITTITSYAYRGTNLKFLTVPNSVTSLPPYCFNEAANLRCVSLPDSLTSISTSSLRECTSLEEIAIPDTVSSLGSYTFYGCESLTSIKVPAAVTSLDTYVFNGCSSLIDITLPNTITSIEANAFSGCGFSELTLPEHLTSIGNFIFSSCSSLMSIIIPASVVSIGDRVFSGCTKLKSVTFEGDVESVGEEIFTGCLFLESVTLPDTITSFGTGLFKGCISLRSANIPSGADNVPTDMFYGCSCLDSITIPNTVTKINQNAFRGCESIKSIDIPENVTSIVTYAFYNCYSLSIIRFHGTTPPTIGGSVFTGLKLPCTIYVPAGTLSAYTDTKYMPSSTTYTYVEY